MTTPRKTHVVDTNVLVRWLVRDHEDHFQRAAQFWNEVREGRCLAHVPEAVVTECYFVLTKTYGVPRAEAARQLQRLLSMRSVVLDLRQVVMAALDALLRRNISITDALVIAHARARGAAVRTFDEDLLKAARAAE